MLKKLHSILFLLTHGLEYIDIQARRIDLLEASYVPRAIPFKSIEQYTSSEVIGGR